MPLIAQNTQHHSQHFCITLENLENENTTNTGLQDKGVAIGATETQPPFYGHYTGQPVLAGTSS